jgi:hypothetical protein
VTVVLFDALLVQFEIQSFDSWASSVEGSTIISGGVLVVIACAFLGYRSCVPKRTKDKLAARALARAVAEYRREEAQYLQQLENMRSPTQATGEPDLYIDRRGSVSVLAVSMFPAFAHRS